MTLTHVGGVSHRYVLALLLLLFLSILILGLCKSFSSMSKYDLFVRYVGLVLFFRVAFLKDSHLIVVYGKLLTRMVGSALNTSLIKVVVLFDFYQLFI